MANGLDRRLDGFEARLDLQLKGRSGDHGLLVAVCGMTLGAGAVLAHLDWARVVGPILLLVGAVWVGWLGWLRPGTLHVEVEGPRLRVRDGDGARDWLLVDLGAQPMRIRGQELALKTPEGGWQAWRVQDGAAAAVVAREVNTACLALAERIDAGPAVSDLAALQRLRERSLDRP
ncbi:MAG: hypothetical protein H6738_21110 [Alphaproteobacteria bacterium]|nr:hypothetical protein [Alphaproteobacteria bacterium]